MSLILHYQACGLCVRHALSSSVCPRVHLLIRPRSTHPSAPTVILRARRHQLVAHRRMQLIGWIYPQLQPIAQNQAPSLQQQRVSCTRRGGTGSRHSTDFRGQLARSTIVRAHARSPGPACESAPSCCSRDRWNHAGATISNMSPLHRLSGWPHQFFFVKRRE